MEQPSIFYLFPGNEFSPRWSMRKLRNEVSNEGSGRISRIRYILLHEERIRIHFWKWSKPRCRPTSSSSYLQLSKTLHPTSASTYPFVSISYSCLVPPPPCFRPKFPRRVLWRKLTLGENRNFKKKFLSKAIWIRVILWEFVFLFNSLNFYFK